MHHDPPWVDAQERRQLLDEQSGDRRPRRFVVSDVSRE
jgi:hypothetical protein